MNVSFSHGGPSHHSLHRMSSVDKSPLLAWSTGFVALGHASSVMGR